MTNKGDNKHSILPPVCALATLLLVFLAVSTAHYFPSLQCPIKATWQIDCPGCGGTRAAQSLITGNFMDAFIYNPIITLGIILVIGYYLYSLFCKVSHIKPYLLQFSIYKGVLCLIVIIIFTITRNL